MKTILVCLLFLSTLCASLAAAETKPNIVYFLIDDMGYADTGFNGSKDFKTPNFDRFAQQGAVLECLYGQPVCSPTRAALMTGRYPVRTGVYNVVQYAKFPQPLPLNERTLAQTLQAAGYTTAISGKWHLGEDSPAYLPTKRGFDHQYGFMGGGINSFTHVEGGRRDAKDSDWYRNDEKSEDTGYSMHLIAKEACRLIRAQPADKPLFLCVTPNAVHKPWLSPEEYQQPYAQLRKGRKQLAGMTAAADEAFGQIMAALKAKGMDTNTLVIFSSDNGGTSWDNVSNNGPLRGGKSDIYEGGFRLVSFVWWPGTIPAGVRIAEPLHVVDWYPTLAKLAGASVKQKLPLDGKDIWPVLTQGAKTPHEEILLMGSRPGQRAIRVGDWKLLVNPMEFRRPTKSSPVELYDLAKDPGEKRDLAAEQPERVKEMQTRLQALTANPANAEFLKHKETNP